MNRSQRFCNRACARCQGDRHSRLDAQAVGAQRYKPAGIEGDANPQPIACATGGGLLASTKEIMPFPAALINCASVKNLQRLLRLVFLKQVLGKANACEIEVG